MTDSMNTDGFEPLGGSGTSEDPYLTQGSDLVPTLRWLQSAMNWAVFNDVPGIYSSNEMRDIKKRINEALAPYTNPKHRDLY